jgi:hypothetical protein
MVPFIKIIMENNHGNCNTPCRKCVDIDNQSMETICGVMNDASDIVLLESNMHKVTFANVPLRVFNLDGQGAGEFCLEMDALHLIPRPHNLVIFYDINHTQVAIRTVGGQK